MSEEINAVPAAESKKLHHLMIDLETLGVQTNAVVLSIGAVCFNITDGTLGKEFEIYPIIETQTNRNIEWGSIKFWFNQPENVRKEQSEAYRNISLLECLNLLNDFCSNNLVENFKVWGNGFDIPLLNQAYNEYNLITPWSYKHIFDCRTITWLSKISTSKYSDDKDQKHNAISDCKYQIRFVVDAFRVINS